ncbi:MAG: MvaI/BcnI restriction endonuclease family protein, partial [Dysgonamonadaceae bacterium]|nr:MvaI/BcnI restriction endonuclease family protein [Dysgonamonadaceae bacterium]
MNLIIYTKDSLIKEFQAIAKKGWIPNARQGNSGGIGNTLEDLLGIEENNLPVPNAAEWELKAQRLNTSSLTTLFHTEPSPRAVKFVPQILLLNYGWQHQEAGKKYPETELSFRQTIHGNSPSDRGFMVKIDRNERKILISFDSDCVADIHKEWLKTVGQRTGLGQLAPQPYWGFDDLSNKAGTKLLNC